MMGRSSEVISDAHLKHKMDALNCKNQNWKPEEHVPELIGENEVMGEKRGAAPGLCGCEECVEPEQVQGDRQE